MEEVIGTKGLCLQEDIGTKVRNRNSVVFLLFNLCLPFVPQICYWHKALKREIFVPIDCSRKLKHLVSRKMLDQV